MLADINNEFNIQILKYKKDIVNRLKDQPEFNEYDIIRSTKNRLEYLGEEVNMSIFNRLINYISYLKLFDIFYHSELIDNNKIDINKLIDRYKLDDPLYIENINKSIFENLKDQIIIKFELKSLSPFLLSVFYICNIIYIKTYVITSNNEMYFIGINLNKDTTINKILRLYNLNIKNINMNTQVIIIDEDYIEQINKIFNKIFNKQLINIIRSNTLL